MIIENLNGLTILYSEGNNKITNTERSLFATIIYLGKNDSVENYQEVPKDIWRNYSAEFTLADKNEQIKLELATLKEETARLRTENAILTELLLENDYRILQQMEMLNSSQKAE